MSLEKELEDTFLEVSMKCPQLQPVILEVGANTIRITSVSSLSDRDDNCTNLWKIKTQRITPGLACKAIEVIPLNDISDIYNVAVGSEHEFIIRQTRHSTIFFSSPVRDLLVKVSFKNHSCASSSSSSVEHPISERPSKGPPTTTCRTIFTILKCFCNFTPYWST